MTSVRQRSNHAGIQAVVGAREQIKQLHITRCRLSTSYSMLRVRKIQSFDLPELQPYRTMRRQEEQRKQGLFVAEGEKVVRRLLESDFRVVSALLPEKWLQELRPLLEKR